MLPPYPHKEKGRFARCKTASASDVGKKEVARSSRCPVVPRTLRVEVCEPHVDGVRWHAMPEELRLDKLGQIEMHHPAPGDWHSVLGRSPEARQNILPHRLVVLRMHSFFEVVRKQGARNRRIDGHMDFACLVGHLLHERVHHAVMQTHISMQAIVDEPTRKECVAPCVCHKELREVLPLVMLNNHHGTSSGCDRNGSPRNDDTCHVRRLRGVSQKRNPVPEFDGRRETLFRDETRTEVGRRRVNFLDPMILGYFRDEARKMQIFFRITLLLKGEKGPIDVLVRPHMPPQHTHGVRRLRMGDVGAVGKRASAHEPKATLFNGVHFGSLRVDEQF